jgi:hypothetical protein
MKTGNDQTNSLFSLDAKHIEAYLDDFLGDYLVAGTSSRSLLSRSEFIPDTFTVLDRFSCSDFLSPWDRDIEEYLKSTVASEVERAIVEGCLTLMDPISATDFIVEQLFKLLEYQFDDAPIATRIFNQELSDVISKVIAFCVFGNPNVDLHTCKSFNQMAGKIIPVLLERHLLKERDIRMLLAYSIGAGMIGLDLKSANAAASSFVSKGIELGRLLRLEPISASSAVFEELEEKVAGKSVIDDWDFFAIEVLGGASLKLVWFLDDFVETFFDLYLAWRLLETNRFLKIVIVPKNGRYGNDASYQDVVRMLHLPLFSPLSTHLRSGRLKALKNGPKMQYLRQLLGSNTGNNGMNTAQTGSMAIDSTN